MFFSQERALDVRFTHRLIQVIWIWRVLANKAHAFSNASSILAKRDIWIRQWSLVEILILLSRSPSTRQSHNSDLPPICRLDHEVSRLTWLLNIPISQVDIY